MVGKEQFEKLSETMKFMTKDGEWYKLVYFEAQSNTCRYKKVEGHKSAKDENTISYEEACTLYSIEIIEKDPLPDEYFFIKIQEPDNNIKRTVSDKTLIRYVKEHTEECEAVIEKLKEIVRTHGELKVRKAAYASCVDIGIEGLEELQKYVNHSEILIDEGIPRTKPNRTNPLNKEKAIVIYMSLAKKYKEQREKITCGVFLNAWKEMFQCDKYNVSKESYQSLRDKQIAAFAFAKGELDDKSLEEIKAYRDTFMIYSSREVPVELMKLAQSKGVVIRLAPNIDKHLSGFDVVINERRMTHQISEVPYGLSESEAKTLLESLPIKKDLKDKESKMMYALKTYPASKELVSRVNKYKAPYATKNFRKFMSHFTVYDCKDKALTEACVRLCKRVGINNPSNERPIEYRFCAGSGMRKKSMKRAKNRRKANAKAAKKGKGKK